MDIDVNVRGIRIEWWNRNNGRFWYFDISVTFCQLRRCSEFIEMPNSVKKNNSLRLLVF